MILMCIFIIQAIWMYIDEFAGKELDVEVIFKFLLYNTPRLVPLVLPLTVLLASIMTFGNFSEQYELAAMKSAGISLNRAMRGLVVVNLLLSLGTFYFANNVIPYSEFKIFNLRKNLAKLKPALAITEGIFNDMGQSNIKVRRKYGENNRFLEDVIIHKKNAKQINHIVIKADRGELRGEEFDQGLQLILYDGYRYEEIKNKKKSQRKEDFPHARVAFEKYTMNIDLSEFNQVDFSEEKFKNTYKMQNINQLELSIDSLETKYATEVSGFTSSFYNRTGVTNIKNNSNKGENVNYTNYKEYLSNYDSNVQLQITSQAISSIDNQKKTLTNQKNTFFYREKVIALHSLLFHDKYALGFIPLILFFVGAPLGAIIRKGGFGLPVVFALGIFLSYHFFGQFTKNWAEDGSVSTFFGTWLPSFILLPFGVYLTIRSTADKDIINLDLVLDPIRSLIQKGIAILKTNKKTAS